MVNFKLKKYLKYKKRWINGPFYCPMIYYHKNNRVRKDYAIVKTIMFTSNYIFYIGIIILILMLLSSCHARKREIKINSAPYTKESNFVGNRKSLNFSQIAYGVDYQETWPEIYKFTVEKLLDHGFHLLNDSQCPNCTRLIINYRSGYIDTLVYEKTNVSPANLTISYILESEAGEPIFCFTTGGISEMDINIRFGSKESIKRQVNENALNHLLSSFRLQNIGKIIEAALGQSDKTVYEFLIDSMNNQSLTKSQRESAAYFFADYVTGHWCHNFPNYNSTNRYDKFLFTFAENEMKKSEGLETLLLYKDLSEDSNILNETFQQAIEKLKLHSQKEKPADN